jgi:hypothetical protein
LKASPCCAADDDRLQPVGVAQQDGQQGGVVVGAVAAGREEDGEAIRVEAETLRRYVPALGGRQDLQVRTRPHQIAAHARSFRGDAALSPR